MTFIQDKVELGYVWLDTTPTVQYAYNLTDILPWQWPYSMAGLLFNFLYDYYDTENYNM